MSARRAALLRSLHPSAAPAAHLRPRIVCRCWHGGGDARAAASRGRARFGVSLCPTFAALRLPEFTAALADPRVLCAVRCASESTPTVLVLRGWHKYFYKHVCGAARWPQRQNGRPPRRPLSTTHRPPAPTMPANQACASASAAVGRCFGSRCSSCTMSSHAFLSRVAYTAACGEPGCTSRCAAVPSSPSMTCSLRREACELSAANRTKRALRLASSAPAKLTATNAPHELHGSVVVRVCRIETCAFQRCKC